MKLDKKNWEILVQVKLENMHQRQLKNNHSKNKKKLITNL